MIELEMVSRMVRRGLVLGPPAVAALWLLGGTTYTVSAAIGLVVAVGNLWLTGRIVGGVAESNPQMLMAAGLGTFFLTLLALTGLGLVLREVEAISFTVMGLTLVVAHLVLILWEALRTLAPHPGKRSKAMTR
ncbi:MAG: ATP synthase subunit I [Actinomycetota bacterium]